MENYILTHNFHPCFLDGKAKNTEESEMLKTIKLASKIPVFMCIIVFLVWHPTMDS